MSINRRSIIKGAVWAAPVVIASATVPAYAASKSTYHLSTSWQSTSKFTNSIDCGSSSVYYDAITFDSNISAYGNAIGFAVRANAGTTAQTTVTLSRFTLKVAFPAGVITSFTVISGAYTVSAPVRQTINGVASDVFTFTYNGTKTSTSLPEGATSPAWPNSILKTTVNFNHSACAPKFSTYYVQFSEAFSTANGYSEDFTSSWIATKVIAA